ncbi:hypothetical protein NB640_06560 [Oxalobacter vibrioformis]|uniref:DUF2782 domain-containing protein n=1 Tax=Oxalobacter vibrioformis TaxID=933080 RepID=A0A9E9P3A8_9BURK|nr:hypothetical protein [Oxalobacter vibrioformis]NLC24717.1 hypothetical protein [Oxalobacter sp.]WAW08956.1 hypothetical protein NB640_06560 [Oxalobacter vibrioformis]
MRVIFDFRLFLFCAAFAAAPFVMAQDMEKGTQPAEELELIDEVEQPTITIRKPDAAKEITERKEQGVVTEVKVQTGVSTYYLYPNKPLGGAFDDVTSKHRPAMWRVHEFDMTGQRTDQTGGEMEDEFDYTSDAPAPPTSK